MAPSNGDPSFRELWDLLKVEFPPHEEPLAWDADAAEAIYTFSSGFHSGQWSNLYAAITECGFQPGPCWRPEEVLAGDGSATEMYEFLVNVYENQGV